MKDLTLLATVLAVLNLSLAELKCPIDNEDQNIFLPNPEDCSTYYACQHGVPILMPYPSGLEWSEELSRCDYPSIAKCKITETEPSVSTTVKPADGCLAEDEEITLPHPTACCNFYKCWKATPGLVKRILCNE